MPTTYAGRCKASKGSWSHTPGVTSLIAAVSKGTITPHDRAKLRQHLRALQSAQDGIYTAFIAKPDGTLIDVVPATPSVVGKNYSFRDWYRGLERTGHPYVSEAYRTQAAGKELVVAVAAYVRSGPAGQVGILVAAYSLDHLQELAQLAGAQNVALTLTDQRGVILATTGSTPKELVSRRADARVGSALNGFTGTAELDEPEGRTLSAYTPVVPDIGWTVTASVPASSAFAGVAKLRSTVLTIAGALALVLLGALLLLVRVLYQLQKFRLEVEQHREHQPRCAGRDAGLDLPGRSRRAS